MDKKDVFLAAVVGEITAWYFLLLIRGGGGSTAEALARAGVDPAFLSFFLPIAFPLMAVAGLWVTWLLGKRFLVIFQAGKFFLVGVIATIVDLLVLNVLILLSGIAAGSIFTLFKGISFLVGAAAKYVGSKLWTFERVGFQEVQKEVVRFYVVALIGLAINVAVASFIVNGVGPRFGLQQNIWANIGAVLAAFVSFVWNFLGSKYIVFKK